MTGWRVLAWQGGRWRGLHQCDHLPADIPGMVNWIRLSRVVTTGVIIELRRTPPAR